MALIHKLLLPFIMNLNWQKKKGVKTELRSDFLIEFCFYFNNKNIFSDAVLGLMKIN
ncbi:hypothetical protein H311_01625 [Anncaliia algerae PRA109]|nr:hypothetical protein H311_01625 [Anncaliia algerae PRA109]